MLLRRQDFIAGATSEAEKNESNAVGFAAWILENAFMGSDKNGKIWFTYEFPEQITTEELYCLYIKYRFNSNTKKAKEAIKQFRQQ